MSDPLAQTAQQQQVNDAAIQQVVADEITLNLFARRVFLLLSIQFTYYVAVTYFVVGNKENEAFHPANWGLDLGLLALWVGILVLVGCFAGLARRSPVIWILFLGFSAVTGFLWTALVAYFDDPVILYIASLGLATSVALYGSSLTSKGLASFAGTALFLGAAIFIVYEIFLIFTDVDLLRLIVLALVAGVLGLFLNYDIPQVLPGNFYRCDPTSHSIAGSIIAFLELLISPVRLCELIGRNMSRAQNPAALAPIAPVAPIA